jgi:hypothetical protein
VIVASAAGAMKYATAWARAASTTLEPRDGLK